MRAREPGWHVRSRRLAALPLALLVAAGAAAPEPPAKVEVVGTALRLTMADGRVLTGDALVGAVLALGDEAGAGINVRIDAVRPDPRDPSGEVTLYALAVEDPASGAWRDLCGPDPDGLALGFPLAGTWTATGEHLPSARAFSLACTSGVIGKCVRMGYRPWAAAADGTPLGPYHQACTRMLRADYCGDGTPHTREGTPVNIADRLRLQTFDPAPEMSFEAAWGADGAICVRRVRIPEAASLAELAAACPARLAGRTGEACTENAALRSPEVLILNRSFAVED
ncbi:MAG TPA: ADYC domain-containing protein [Geminicoccaceae bacterium]|nr:ADYC domain-containing protein [Geminicoccaceae bacterium]